MKKLIALILSAALCVTMAFTFTSCGSSGTEGTDTRATLSIGLECVYPPFNWTQTDSSNGAVKIDGMDGYANGYDIKVAKYIADALDRRLVVKQYVWSGLIAGVTVGSIDMIVAGMSPTAERKESIDFTDAYYTSELVIVVRKDGAYASAKTLNDFSGAKIVAQVGTYHEEAEKQIPGAVIQTSMDDFSTMILALNAKTVDGYIAEKPGAIANCKVNSDFTYIDLINNGTGFTVSAEDVDIAVGLKKNSTLREQINSILSGLTQEMRDNLMKNAINQQPKA